VVDRIDAMTTAVDAPDDAAIGSGPPAAPWTDPLFGSRLLAALPAAAFVIDGVGTIEFATETAAALVGRHAEDMVGESVLSFVDAQTSWAYAASVAMATDYPTVFMGPLRVTFTSADGERTADLWAMNRLDDPEIGGIVCLLTEETAAVGLGDAIAALANNDDLDEIIRRVASAMRGHPVVGAAAVAIRKPGGSFRIVRPAAPDAKALVDDLFTDDALWADAVASGQRRLCGDLGTLAPTTRDAAASSGFEAVWVEPIPGPGDEDCTAALIVWRRRPGNPSPNQLNSVHQAAGILSVALRLDALGGPA
jgi:hypothetical protein